MAVIRAEEAGRNEGDQVLPQQRGSILSRLVAQWAACQAERDVRRLNHPGVLADFLAARNGLNP